MTLPKPLLAIIVANRPEDAEVIAAIRQMQNTIKTMGESNQRFHRRIQSIESYWQSKAHKEKNARDIFWSICMTKPETPHTEIQRMMGDAFRIGYDLGVVDTTPVVKQTLRRYVRPIRKPTIIDFTDLEWETP